jgi:hypothetical protein
MALEIQDECTVLFPWVTCIRWVSLYFIEGIEVFRALSNLCLLCKLIDGHLHSLMSNTSSQQIASSESAIVNVDKRDK